jgi:hypothetical protein
VSCRRLLYVTDYTRQMDGNTIRTALLEVLAEHHARGVGFFQSGSVLDAVRRKLNVRGTADEQAVLTLFHDLFRTGQLAWGYDLANPDAPFMHWTDAGRQMLMSLSHDPANPGGYLAYLQERGSLGEVAMSYITEALVAYNSACFKAAAVMAGGAAESVVLQLRDKVLEHLEAAGRTPPKGLKEWQIKRVLDALKQFLDQHKASMSNALTEAYSAYWPAFTQQIRAARNDAGHPSGLTSVTPETVHASLLIFPELAKVSRDLEDWLPKALAN